MGEWLEAPLADLVECLDHRRQPVREQDRVAGPFPYYGASGVIDHVGDFIFEGLHLLIAEDGENLRTRKTPVAFLAAGKFWVNNHAHIVRGNHRADTRYLAYAVQAADISGFLTGSTQPKLTKDSMLRIRIPSPPLTEQRAIAGVLGALDDKIESNRRIVKMLEAEARLVFGSQFDPSPQPVGVPLSDLVEINPPRRLRQGTEATYVGMSDLPTSSALIEQWESRPAGSGQRFVNGDVLLARITPCLENGKTALVDVLAEGETGWGSTEYIVFSAKGRASAEWVYCLARSEPFVQFAVRNMTGTSGRQRCPATAFDKYYIAPPDSNLVVEFGQRFGASFRRMGMARDENRVLANLRDALLPELLSGRLRVREVEEMVGSV